MEQMRLRRILGTVRPHQHREAVDAAARALEHGTGLLHQTSIKLYEYTPRWNTRLLAGIEEQEQRAYNEGAVFRSLTTPEGITETDFAKAVYLRAHITPSDILNEEQRRRAGAAWVTLGGSRWNSIQFAVMEIPAVTELLREYLQPLQGITFRLLDGRKDDGTSYWRPSFIGIG